ENKRNNKLTIGFDIEGCEILNGQQEMVSKFYDLGVRQIQLTYNLNNSAGGGCLDEDMHLSEYGKQLILACNKIGMVIDCSHSGYKTSMDMIELSSHPVIFSHSNPAK